MSNLNVVSLALEKLKHIDLISSQNVAAADVELPTCIDLMEQDGDDLDAVGDEETEWGVGGDGAPQEAAPTPAEAQDLDRFRNPKPKAQRTEGPDRARACS